MRSAIITLNEGERRILSSDDAINISDGSGSSDGDRPGRFGKTTATGDMTINGGYTYIDCEGDGLDANGSAVMNGGLVIVNGPTTDKNGAIDVNGSFDMNGGELIAVGSSGMAETPSSSSSQYSIKVTFPND